MIIKLLCMSFILAIFSIHVQAQDRFFPYKVGPDGTLRAPFAELENEEPETPFPDLYDPLGDRSGGSTPLDTPHRSVMQLSRWSSERIAHALSFDGAQNPMAKMQDQKRYFSESGWDLYSQFLESQNFWSKLNSNRAYHVASFTLQDPELLAQGVQDGIYKWAYEVPITLNHGIKRGNGAWLSNPPENLQFDIIVQLTRSADSQQDVLIEHWGVRTAQPARTLPSPQ